MRLLKRLPGGGLEMVSFEDNKLPPYAILSHTWAEGQEVQYEEFIAGPDAGKTKTGWDKIRFCEAQAAADGLDYFWIDTCCINRKPDNEVTIAINSMFRWYRQSQKCYVYLTDVEGTCPSWKQAFRRSRWFTRGWTLQELIAPNTIEFFSRDSWYLGDKISLEQEIQRITGLPLGAIRGQDLEGFGVEERFSWSASRNTTFGEDKAYCLLGIFGVFMPKNYGEGEEYATERLRREIRNRREEQRRQRSSLGLGVSSVARVAYVERAYHTMIETLLRQTMRQSGNNGNVDSSAADASFWLGYSLYQQGDYGDAEISLRKAVREQHQAGDTSHLGALHSKQLLGHTLHAQAKYTEAENFLQQATTAWRKLRRQTVDVLFSSLLLGHAQYRLAKYEIAEGTLRKAAAGIEQLCGRAHRDRVCCIHLLGCALYRQAKYSEAIKVFEEALKHRENVLGENHVDTLVSKCWLGRTTLEQMKYKEATHVLQQVVDRCETNLHDDVGITAKAKYLLGRALYHQEKYGQAERLLREAVDTFKTINSKQTDIINTKRLLGRALYHQAKYSEAGRFFRHAADDCQMAFGRDNMDTVELKQLLGHALYLQAKYAGAERVLREAMASQEKMLGRHHDDTQLTKGCLDRVLADQRKQKRVNAD